MDWKATKQRCITLSTMEAEYVALSKAVNEASWLKMYIEELGMYQWFCTPYELYCDNRATIDFAKNRIERSKTKHIDIAYHNVRERVDDGTITLSYVPSALNNADILTKAISRKMYEEHVERLGLNFFTKSKSGGLMGV